LRSTTTWARARLVEIAFQHEQRYDIAVGTTLAEDRVCATQLEAAIAVLLGLLPEQVNITVTVVSQEDVDLHFGVYERMLAEKMGVVLPIQWSSGGLRGADRAPVHDERHAYHAKACRSMLQSWCP
jgi:hypothetical protein